jgi:hypothetical protein
MNKNRIKVIVAILFLSMFTGCVLAFPTTLTEFAVASGFSFLFWGSMFIGTILDPE